MARYQRSDYSLSELKLKPLSLENLRKFTLESQETLPLFRL
jgi:hypothetical protein